MAPAGSLTWNIDELASALAIQPAEVKEYFTDGRRISFLIERRVSREVIKGKLAKSEGAAYDLIDPQGKKWEVRSISNNGIYFCPSYMVGSSRSFNEEGFLIKLNEIEGYILCDIAMFPQVPFWIVKKEIVHDWYYRKLLGTTTKIDRTKALALLKGLPHAT